MFKMAEIEVEKLEVADVITTSPEGTPGNDDNDLGWG